MDYAAITDISNMISIRNYIDNTINNPSLTKEQVNKLQILIRKMDQRIVSVLLSRQFKSHLNEF